MIEGTGTYRIKIVVAKIWNELWNIQFRNSIIPAEVLADVEEMILLMELKDRRRES